MKSEIKMTSGGLPVKNMAELLLDVCRGYGISLENIQSKARTEMLVRARKVLRFGLITNAAQVIQKLESHSVIDITQRFYFI